MPEEKRIQGKGRRKVCLAAFIAALCLGIGLLLVPGTVKASGLVEFVQNAGNLYSSYALENYDLDFYVDTSWSWLPWNWMDGVGRSVMYGLYCFTNVIWHLSRLLSFVTGEIVQESYRLDLVNEMSDSIGTNMQRIAGVSPAGFSTDGFYPGFIMLIILVLGVYVAYTGLIKRETSKALGAVVNSLVLFLVTTALIVYAPTCIRSVNEFSSDVSGAALRLGTGLTMPGADMEGEDSVDLIRNNLFSIQVYQPWLLLQYGTTDINAIGQERVNRLLVTSPDAEYGAARENIVKEEINTYGNLRMTVTKVAARLGEVFFIFLVNLIISIFVILLCALMILTQILFIIYVLFMVVSFVLSMFPACNGLAKQSLLKVFNVIMMRAGYTLLVTVTFTLSTMIYRISGGHSFLLIGFLQILTFAGIFLGRENILQMMTLQGDATLKRAGMLGHVMLYSKMRQGMRKHEKRKAAAKEAGERFVGFNAGVVKDGAVAAGGKINNIMEHRALAFQKERAAQSSAVNARRRQELDYTAAADVPVMESADFHGVSSKELYDRHYMRAYGHDLGKDNGKSYKAAESSPDLKSAEISNHEQRIAREKYRRPWLHAKGTDSKEIRESYYGRRLENKRADMPGWDTPALQEPDDNGRKERVRYHAAAKTALPDAKGMRSANRNEVRTNAVDGRKSEMIVKKNPRAGEDVQVRRNDKSEVLKREISQKESGNSAVGGGQMERREYREDLVEFMTELDTAKGGKMEIGRQQRINVEERNNIKKQSVKQQTVRQAKERSWKVKDEMHKGRREQ